MHKFQVYFSKMSLFFVVLMVTGELLSQVHGQNAAISANGGSTGFIPVMVNPSSGSAGTGAAPSTGFFSSPSAPLAPGPLFAPAPAAPSVPAPAAVVIAPSVTVPAPPAGMWPARPQSNLDALSVYASDFLTSLNKDQLTSFLRVYFLSRMMGTSLLDPRAALTRTVMDPQVRRAIDTVKSMPMVPSQMASLESTQVGAVLDNYAARMKTASPAERGYLVRDYQNTIEKLQIPKGVKYALKHLL